MDLHIRTIKISNFHTKDMHSSTSEWKPVSCVDQNIWTIKTSFLCRTLHEKANCVDFGYFYNQDIGSSPSLLEVPVVLV